MRRIENDCVGCEYCINCGQKRVLKIYCDRCEDLLEHYDLTYGGTRNDEDYCAACLEEETNTLIKEVLDVESSELSEEEYEDFFNNYFKSGILIDD